MNEKRIYTTLIMLWFALNMSAIKVVFRVDDLTVQYDSVDSRIVQLFVEKKIPLSIGVIPCCSEEVAYAPDDSVYLELLKQPNIEICLHGYLHARKQDQGGRGEFGGLEADESERRIVNGKEILYKYLDKEIVTFIPPWNAYNSDLPAILINNGFRIISGELFDESFAWMPKDVEMNYIPETLGHLWQHEGVWNAARNSIFGCKDKEAVCVVMFHKYDLPDEKSWCVLENLLDDCKKSNNVALYTFSSLLESGEMLNRTRYKANLLYSGLAKITLPKGVMFPTWICYIVHTLNAILYILIAISGFVVLLTKNFKKKRAVVAMFITMLIIFCAAWWHWTSPLKLLVVTLIVGIIPWIMAIVKRKNCNL